MREILQLYRVGRKMGLSNKEIDKIILSSSYHRRIHFKIIFLILFIITSSFIGIMIAAFIETAMSNTYPTGTRYSTVKIKDFDKKNEAKHWLRKKIRSQLL